MHAQIHGREHRIWAAFNPGDTSVLYSYIWGYTLIIITRPQPHEARANPICRWVR